jgi:hypothetical protein
MTERLILRLAAVALVAATLSVAGRASARSTVNVSGSIYVDEWWISKKDVSDRSLGGITPEGALKVSVDVHDDLSISAKACFSCHGIEMEHIAVEYTPRNWFNVTAGRVVVPFGEYANRVDPSSHRTVSAPLIFDMGRMPYFDRAGFNLGVVPAPYVDTGVVVYGQTWIANRIQVWYGAYGVAGLKGSNDVDWVSMRSAYYADNNRLPAGGGRLALTWSQEDPTAFIGDVSLGGSFTGGRYDQANALGYAAWGADAQVRLGPVTLRGEYAARRTHIDPNASGYRFVVRDPFFDKRGWYAEIEHPIGKYVSAVYRVDRMDRIGVPIPGSLTALSPDSRIKRYTAGVMVTPVASFFLKASYEYWDMSDFGAIHSVHAGVGGSF